MLVPLGRGFEIGIIDLNVTHIGFGKPACQQTLTTEIVGGLLADAVMFQSLFRFFAEIHHPRCMGLHAVGEFVGIDHGIESFVFGSVFFSVRD